VRRIYSLFVIGALNLLLISCGSNSTSARPSTTTLSSSLNPAAVDESITFTATVTGQRGTPTGSMTFDVNGNSQTPIPLTNGQAVFLSIFDDAGPVTLTANYSGDGTYAPSTSAAFTQTVNPDVVTISGSPQQPLTQNTSGDYVAVVTVTNTGDVTISSLQVTVTGTTLGSGSLLSAPAAVTNLAPGANSSVTLTFPSDSVPAGTTTATLALSGTYSASTGSLSGNWGLTFRSVSL
jgi:archaellum component FlaG (FlaF/FlaG flagellin family)